MGKLLIRISWFYELSELSNYDTWLWKLKNNGDGFYCRVFVASESATENGSICNLSLLDWKRLSLISGIYEAWQCKGIHKEFQHL